MDYSKSIAGNPIAEVTSDENGDYSLILPSVRVNISLFTVEEDGLFANSLLMENGNIEPLLIKKGGWVTRNLVINYSLFLKESFFLAPTNLQCDVNNHLKHQKNKHSLKIFLLFFNVPHATIFQVLAIYAN